MHVIIIKIYLENTFVCNNPNTNNYIQFCHYYLKLILSSPKSSSFMIRIDYISSRTADQTATQNIVIYSDLYFEY